MFSKGLLKYESPKLAMMAALAILLIALMLLAGSARPAHACLSTPAAGTDSFAAAPKLRVGYKDTLYSSGELGTISSCSFPNRINTYGSTSGATMEAGEPWPYSSKKDCGIYGVSNNVWWKVTVGPYDLPSFLYGGWGAKNAYLKLSTEGSSFDTVLAVYTGTSLTTLQQHYCSNTNALPNWTDKVYAQIIPGQTYYVQLTGTGGARSGSYVLNSRWVLWDEYKHEAYKY